MITKTILLKENECALDAIASLCIDSKNAWIYIDKMCFYDMRKTCSNINNKENNSYQIYWKATSTVPETTIKFTQDITKWYDVQEIRADDIAFTLKPLNPKIIFFITKDYEKKLSNATQMYVPENMCPIDFITNLGEKAKDKIFIFPKYLVSKIMMGRMKKTISRLNKILYILWDENDDFIEFHEIDTTHTYILANMDVDNFMTNNLGNELIYLV